MKRFVSFLICLVFSFSVIVGTVVRADAAVIDASALFLSKSALTYAEATGVNVAVSGMSAAEVGAAFSSYVSSFAAEQGVTEAALAAEVGAGITMTPKSILITAAAAAILSGILHYVFANNSELEQVDMPVVLSSSNYFILNDGSKFLYSTPVYPFSDRDYCAFDTLPVNSIDVSYPIDLVANFQNHSVFWSNIPIGESVDGSPLWSWDNFEIVPRYRHTQATPTSGLYRLDLVFRYITAPGSYYSYNHTNIASATVAGTVRRPDSNLVNNHFIIPFYNSDYRFLGFAFPTSSNTENSQYPFVCYNSRYDQGDSGTLQYTNLYNYLYSGTSSGTSSLSFTRTDSFELPTFDDADNIRITIPDTSSVELNPSVSPDTVLDPIIEGVFSELPAARPKLALDVVTAEPPIVEPDIPDDPTLPFLPAISTPWHYVVELLNDVSDFVGVWITTFTSVLPEPFVNCLYAAVVLLVTFGIIMRFL